MALYKIMSGVHRSVAAREAGLSEIKAVVDRGQGLGPPEMVLLSELVSHKPSIGRWDRNRDFMVLLAIMLDPIQRDGLESIELMMITPARAKYLMPLKDVVLNPI
jgi:hypothetical protein